MFDGCADRLAIGGFDGVGGDFDPEILGQLRRHAAHVLWALRAQNGVAAQVVLSQMQAGVDLDQTRQGVGQAHIVALMCG